MANILLLHKKYDIILIKSYFYFANFLGLTPIYSFEESKIIHPTLYRFYVSILFILFVSLYTYSTYGMFLQFFNNEITKIVFALELIMYGLMHLICIYGMFKSTYKKGQVWGSFLKGILSLDSSLNNKVIEGKSLRMEATGQIIYLLILISYGIVWSINKGFDYYKYYFLEIIEYFYMYTIIVLASNFALTLKNRFKICNKIITQRIKKNKIKISILSKNVKKKSAKKTNFIYFFSKLSQLVEIYNFLFGPLILIFLG